MMTYRCLPTALCLLFLAGASGLAQAPVLPPGDKDPVLRLEAGGPTSFVTALAFSPDGKTLYAAGFDKVVHVWNLNARTGKFVPDQLAYRVPINPGLDGAINALALSPGGNWLAVAGMGVIREGAGFRQPGLVLPIIGGMSPERWQDRGIIYIFSTKKPQVVRPLRGHRGTIEALAFAPPAPDNANEDRPPPLFSIARERDLDTDSYQHSIGLWDVAKGKKTGWTWPVDSDWRPGLSVWRAGDGPRQLHAAFAWGDGNLHFWDVERNKTFDVHEHGQTNNSVAILPGQRRVLTGSFQDRTGRLNVWRVAAGTEPRMDPAAGKTIPQGGQEVYFPLALALLSSGPGGKPDHAAVVLRAKEGKEEKDGLHLVSLADFGTVNDWVPLWSGGINQPVLAAVPGGRFLAVAGNDDHEITLFSIPNLLTGRRQPVQKLRSPGALVRFATFVHKGKEIGLVVSDKAGKAPGALPRQPRTGDLLFDFDRRSLLAYKPGEWQTFTAPLDGWAVMANPAKKDATGRAVQWLLTIRQGGAEKSRIVVNAKEVTDYALLPPLPPLQVPLLSVATLDESAQPMLGLYHAATGEQLRQLTGHTDPIRCLAFSADGRLLASAAEDQTVCVWSLTTLSRSLGVRGLLKGVAVKGVPAVSAVEPDSPARGRLQQGDLIDGLMEGTTLHPLPSLRAMTQALAAVELGKTVVLRVRNPQGKPRDVPLVLGRGWDDRRWALLSIGLTNPLEVINLAHSARLLLPFQGVGFKTTLLLGQVDPDRPATDKLSKGDVIEGVLIGGRLQPLGSPRQFYETIELMKPKTTVTLRLRGKGNVPLVVGQAIYEWKPLFSLFLTRDGSAEEREWIGWNPNGQYESSAPKADRLIGWHFNTGDPREPTRFATADQYRKEYYREGILKHLVARGSLSPALKDWEDENRRKKLPQPKMTLWIDEVQPDLKKGDNQGPVLVRQPQATLKLAIDDFPLERVDSLTWQFDAQAQERFPQAVGLVRTADLSGLTWTRGAHKIRVVLRTQEEQPQEYVQELTLRYQPKPPTIQSNLGQRLLFVDKPDFTVQATVLPGLPGQEVEVSLSQRHDNKEVLGPVGQQGLQVNQQIHLQPGENLVEVIARNKEALSDHQQTETSRRTWIVTYKPPAAKVLPPSIALNQVELLQGESAQGSSLEIKPGTPIVADVAKIRIVGQITASERLSAATWKRGDAVVEESLANFSPDKQFSIRQELTLKPGPQQIQFLAKTATSGTARADIVVDYRPRLPTLVMIAPPSGSVLYGEGGTAETELTARLIPPPDRQEFTATVFVNGRELVDRRLNLDLKTHNLAFKVPLQPGANKLQVRLSNRWQVTSMSEEIAVRYLRPPRITRFDGLTKSTKPFVTLTAQVDSALPLQAVEARVNERALTTAEVIPPANPKTERTWTVSLPHVALDGGRNDVQLWVSNTEARCRQPAEQVIIYEPARKPPALPEIELLEPRTDGRVTDPELTVRFRVRSASPLRRIELLRENGVLLRRPFDLSTLQRDALGFYEVKTDLRLEPHANRLRVEATNDGGVASAAAVVNYVPMPVLLDIDSVEIKGQDRPILPTKLRDGRLSFPKLPGSWVTLKGHVTGSQANEESFRGLSSVRICINGFQQMPVLLDPPAGRRRSFEAPVLLNRAENNLVEISLPELKQDASNRQDFAVDCAKPEPIHHLHVLIVGIDEKDQHKLIERVLQALHGHLTEDNRFTTPVFGEGRPVEGQLYGPLTEDVTPGRVLAQLYGIKWKIDRLAHRGAVNDVVLVYYVGSEAVNLQGHFFLTDRSAYDPQLQRSAVSCDGLVNHFTETLGAQLLLLDVTRRAAGEASAPGENKDRIAKWYYNPHLGVFRYAWRDPTGRPNDTWLITDLEAAISARTPTLGKVASQIAALFNWQADRLTYVSRKHQQKLTLDEILPVSLADLRVNETP